MEINKVEQIIEKISDAFKKGGIYPNGHPVPQKLNQQLEQWLNSVLEAEIDLSIAQDKLIYKDKIVGENNPLLRQFALNLHQKGIGRVSLQKGIIAQEIEIFFNILILKSELVRQQDIGEFFKQKGLIHIGGSKLHYKEVFAKEKESALEESKDKDEGYFKILEFMKEPGQINEAFAGIAKRDIDMDVKAEFINQGIEEMNGLLLGKSPQERERISAAVSQSMNQLSSSLVSRVLDLRQKNSLGKKEDIEDYISSIATIVGDFSQGWKLEDDFSQESIYSLDESDNVTLELIPYSYKQEYAEAVAYLQRKIPELLEKKAYSQCQQLLRFFIEDNKIREDDEKEMLSTALEDCKQADLALQKDILFLLKDEAGEAIDAFLIAEIENEDKELSENALTALGRRRCLSAVPALLSLLNPGELFFKDVDWEKKIIENLGTIGDERAVPKLKRMLEKRWFFLRNKKLLREAAADALKKIGSQEAIRALLEASARSGWIRYGR